MKPSITNTNKSAAHCTSTLLLAFFLLLTSPALVLAEEAGEAIDETVEDAGDSIEEATEDLDNPAS